MGLNFYHHPGFQPMIICKTVYLLGTPCKCIILWSSPWGKPFLAFWEFVFTVGPRPVVLFRAVGTGCAITFRFQILERIKAKPFPGNAMAPLKFSEFPTALILLPPSVRGPVPASFARKHSRYIVGVAAWMKTQNVWRCSSVHTAQKRATKHYSKCTMDWNIRIYSLI